MNKIARRLLILALFVLCLTPAVWLSPYYKGVYLVLEKYHVEGIGVCWLGSYVIANLCAPWWMQGAGSKTDYENSGPIEIIKLYLSVMGITFGVLAVVTVFLWCVGWFLVLITLPLDLLREWLRHVFL